MLTRTGSGCVFAVKRVGLQPNLPHGRLSTEESPGGLGGISLSSCSLPRGGVQYDGRFVMNGSIYRWCYCATIQSVTATNTRTAHIHTGHCWCSFFRKENDRDRNRRLPLRLGARLVRGAQRVVEIVHARPCQTLRTHAVPVSSVHADRRVCPFVGPNHQWRDTHRLGFHHRLG
jgi:hypothetical protein